jgi:hypothetical protein
MHHRFLLLVLLCLFTFSTIAQNKTYKTNKISGPAPEIDGIIDDQIWENFDWEGDFTQFQPQNGKKPSQQTAFKIIYDNDNIYVAIKAYDSETDKIEQRMTRRDGWEGDRVGVHIDSYNDKRTAFVFFVNASGVKNDGIMTNDGGDFDDSWDPIWQTKTSIDKDGWNAEMKIPLSQLRFSQKEEQHWGLQVVRDIFRESEKSLWQHIPSGIPGWTSHYGEIEGIKSIKPKRQVEIAPFVVGKFDKYEKEEGNPYSTGKDLTYNIGLDGKIGITNNMILDFTINPDFGQVEADPSEVNLSAFESFFSEKRPFFIEGKNITDYQITPGGSPWSSDNLFYSRRIGRRPHGEPDLGDNEYADIPDNTRIIGAFKLTGKTKNGWSVGIIENIANEEIAEIDTEGERHEEVVEPYTNYLLGRIQKDINKGNTIIGGMFTTTHRRLKDTGLDNLNSNALTGGVDFRQYFLNKKYYLSAMLVTSKINGSTEAMLEQQTSSRRYYQRPDANYLSIDSSLTFLTGHGGNISFGKQTNSGLRFRFNTTWRSPGLELNDVGYMRQANTVFQYLWAGYSITKPFSVFRRININMNQWSGWDFGSVNLFNGGNINLLLQFTNLWAISGGYNIDFENISNTMLRGGSSMKMPGSQNYRFSFGTNYTKKIRFNGSVSRNKGNENYQESIRYSTKITYQPIDNISFSLNPGFSSYSTDLQYIDEFSYNNESRYIFGKMAQKTFTLTARVDFNITPDLTIQFYASPFVSAGDFSEFKRITSPKADNYTDRFRLFGNEILYSEENNNYSVYESASAESDYSFDNPDFNFKQFRSNLVVRWEYIPGSIFYMVWSQGKTASDEYGTFSYADDMGDLFRTTGQNTFLIKISHRIRAGRWL